MKDEFLRGWQSVRNESLVIITEDIARCGGVFYHISCPVADYIKGSGVFTIGGICTSCNTVEYGDFLRLMRES